MHCTHCGKELGEDDVFCTACGTRVERPEPTEEAPVAVPESETTPDAEPVQPAPEESPAAEPVDEKSPAAEPVGEPVAAEPTAAKPTPKPQKAPITPHLPAGPVLATACLLSAIAFVLSIVLCSIVLANHFAIAVDTLLILPALTALAALVMNVFTFYRVRGKGDRFESILCYVAFGLAGFALFFAFVACGVVGTF